MSRAHGSRRSDSGEHALEHGTIRRLAVSGQHELDRQIEQRAEPSDDIVTRHVLAISNPDVQPVAEDESESPATGWMTVLPAD